MSNKPLLAIAYVLAGLIAVVVIVGLAQQKLDPTGTATVLSGVLSGVVAGVVLREKSKGGGDEK